MDRILPSLCQERDVARNVQRLEMCALALIWLQRLAKIGFLSRFAVSVGCEGKRIVPQLVALSRCAHLPRLLPRGGALGIPTLDCWSFFVVSELARDPCGQNSERLRAGFHDTEANGSVPEDSWTVHASLPPLYGAAYACGCRSLGCDYD